MQVTLTPEQERFVRSQMRSGHYGSVEEAIIAELKLLREYNCQ